MQELKRTVKISVSFLIGKNVMNSNHFILSIILSIFYSSVYIYILINNKTSATAFINTDFVKLHCLKLCSFKCQYKLNVVDKYLIDSEMVAHCAILIIRMLNHSEDIFMFIIKLRHYLIILDIK